MNIVAAGKVTLNSTTPTQLSTLPAFANVYQFAVRKVVFRASETATGNVFVGVLGVTTGGANALGAVQKLASPQTDALPIGGGNGNEVHLDQLYAISANTTDTVYIYAEVE